MARWLSPLVLLLYEVVLAHRMVQPPARKHPTPLGSCSYSASATLGLVQGTVHPPPPLPRATTSIYQSLSVLHFLTGTSVNLRGVRGLHLTNTLRSTNPIWELSLLSLFARSRSCGAGLLLATVPRIATALDSDGLSPLELRSRYPWTIHRRPPDMAQGGIHLAPRLPVFTP